ncbi:tigger transposable element-derived protein 4-like isoform X2 [Lytechinus variegatus]|uniref:tigger transposable element-derived protein 4-like isoform X2 n=1 Tax=Lytechinus variegatus TaxID=7654 RepID=UPI001BB25296|nr:tigger transposable element-derived protein 4-like isoform X2 [Lytechinus variegatus]
MIYTYNNGIRYTALSSHKFPIIMANNPPAENDLAKKKNFRKNNDDPLVLPKSAADKQRMQIEKLMRNPEKPVFIPDAKKEWTPRAPAEFVRDVMGSSAGAGSGEFHVYRGYRRRENARQAFIQNKAEKDEQDREYHKKLEENQKLANQKTAKKRAKSFCSKKTPYTMYRVHRRQALSIETKMEILGAVERGERKTDVAREYNLPSSTLSSILKNKEKIKEHFDSAKIGPSRKRIRLTDLEDLEEAVVRWVNDRRSKNFKCTGPLIRKKALLLAIKQGRHDFVASTGWLTRFKERNSIKLLPQNEVWMDDALPDKLGKYKPRDIFSADETSIFHPTVQARKMMSKGKQYHGAKQDMDQLSVVVCANMDGSEKPKPLVIQNPRNPSSFNSSPEQQVNKKVWTETDVFVSWVKKLDNTFSACGRKILLFINDCSTRPHIPNLQSIEFEFIQSKKTLNPNPMGQGVITNFKKHYDRRLVSYLDTLQCGETSASFSVKDATDMIYWAWQQVTSDCIIQSFEKAHFLVGAIDPSLIDSDVDKEVDLEGVPGPSCHSGNIHDRMKMECEMSNISPNKDDKTLNEEKDQTCLEKVMQSSIIFSEFTPANEYLMCTAASSGEDLVKIVSDSSDNDEASDVTVLSPPPSFSEVINCLQRVRDFLYSKQESSDKHYDAVTCLEKHILKYRDSTPVQNKAQHRDQRRPLH